MITIFTPTYNREKLLYRVYESLKHQTKNDFEWLIVDDGSVDNTKQTVQKWLKEGKINIRYIYQKNQGKHIAFNTAVRAAKGELFFCVDSDDYIVFDAVELVTNTWEQEKNSKTAGIIALKSDNNGEKLCDSFPDDVINTTAYDLVYKYHCGGEKTMIYKTSILKSNPYPKVEGENFIGECVVYDRIDNDYVMILLNKVLTICEYQLGGLTNKIFDLMLKNPTGYKIYYSQRINMAYTMKERINYVTRYNAFKILSNDQKYNYHGKYRFIVGLFKPAGWLLTKYYKIKKRFK